MIQPHLNRGGFWGLFIAFSVLVSLPAFGQALPESVLPSPDTFVPNGGFDAGDSAAHPIAWSVTGAVDGVKVINRKDDRTAGMASLEITSAKDAPVSVKSQRLTAVVDGAYTLSAKVKIKSGAGASLGIEFWSFDGKRLSEKHVAPSKSDEWQTVSVEATAPENSAHVIAAIEGAKDSDGISFWDEVELRLAPLAYDPAIGAQRELFLDDYRIASAYHVERVVHPAQVTSQPVLRPDKAWESSAYIYGSVLKMNGKYRMWYCAYGDLEPHYRNAYAESTDGLTWTKPNLGLVEYKGSKENNLAEGNAATYNPDAPPERRYASLGFKQGVPNETMGYYIKFSSDGLSWKHGPDKPALLDGDVCNLAFDPVKKLYLATVKKRMFTARTPGIYERSAFISTSPDAITWASPRLAVMADYADDGIAESTGELEAQIYGMPLSRYESVYVGFPWVYYIHDYVTGEAARTGDGPVEVQIAASRDLYRWSRPIRKPIIETGKPGAWDDGCHYTASNFIVEDDKIVMYYGAFNNGHGGSDAKDPHRGGNVGQTGRATWRRDGWASLTNASQEGLGNPGQVTTKPIKFTGKSLHLNAAVRPGGKLRVEVLDANGAAMPGYSATVEGDQLNATVKWSDDKDLGDLAGKEVAIRFNLVNADLYSYWIAP